ncbi:ATP-binding protein, partial [Actinoplanes octamycinicus]
MFERVAIVNRGEAAMRLIHAVRDLSAQTGTRVQTVALYTDEDRTATFVREADLAHPIGPAAARPYLDHAVLERALLATGADAAWVGWGFVAEDPAFAELCERIGVTFIGPSPEAMRQLGDKIGSKLIAEKVGVPVAPWSRGEVATLADALRAGDEIGYPLMLKATAGGGGRGIRMVASADDLTEAYERTSQEALRAFGSGVVFLERLVTGARHVEVQVIADGQGTAWALGVRDCSVQRRNQKVIEESASPVMAPEQAAELKASAVRLALEVGYRGAGTVEFLYHPGEKLFAFLEVNTRLQVEHPITEITTGTDLVRLQLHVAAGGRLEGAPPAEAGHAVEARLNAEDPDRDFAPSPGRIARLDLPAGPGIRVDTGVSEGDRIPAAFDSMIAKIIAYGRDREEALGRLRRAMAETTVIIEGGATNKSFVLDLLDQPEVIDGSADTGWIDRVRADGRLVGHRHSAIALAAAAVEAYRDEEEVTRQRLLSTAHGGRPQARHESGRPLDLKLRGIGYRVWVARAGGDRFRVGIAAAGGDVHHVDVRVERYDAHTGRLIANGQRFRVVSATHGPVHTVEVDGVTHRISRDEGGVVRAPAPALVVATPLAVGDEVAADAPVLVLESMKMETVLRAPFRARVRECPVVVGSQVETGAPLMRLEPIAGEETGAATAEPAAKIEIDLPAEPSHLATAEDAVGELRTVLLGYDTDAEHRRRTLAGYLAARAGSDGGPLAAELDLLTVFADLLELGRNRAGDLFHTYLRSLDVERAGSPPLFRTRLTRVLGHYGVTGLDRKPELEDAIFRIFLAQQRASDDAAVAAEVLRQWLADPPPAGAEAAGRVLEHLIEATQVRFPAVADLARGVVFRWFAQPLLRRGRAEVYAAIRADLRHLDQHPDAPDRAERIDRMVAGAAPLVRLFGQRIGRPGRDHSALLEAQARRYYGDATVFSAAVPVSELDQVLDRLPAGIAEADIYLAWPGQPDAATMATRLGALIADHAVPAAVHRITVVVAAARGTVHHHFTFRRGASGFTEDPLIRDLHPRLAERLRLPALRAFDLTRLPSADEEIYLFQAAAKSNPADERLIAMNQIRDLTPLRDADGTLVALPTAEAALASSLDAIRAVQARRPAHQRFDTNRIVMYVWPVADLDRADLDGLIRRILPTTAGAGLEEILIIGRQPDEVAVRIVFAPGQEPRVEVGAPPDEPVRPVDGYRQKVLRAARRGTVYPYELVEHLGTFEEYDLDERHMLTPVSRPKGGNAAALVAGVVRTVTSRHPEGITRVVLLGDPTKSLGALSEPECRRVIAALDLAESLRVPLEWYALSSGARISMSSGTENMDWVAAALKRIVEFTQAGGEINIVVAGINVGAQPYWNAEATMLMHTKGILVMTPDSAMVLTGKQSLDFSGGVSAEDNFGIGGYDRVMGPNGQAQYWAPNLMAARDVLMSHYDHTYVVPGETGPRPVESTDPVDRDISDFPHVVDGSDFTTVGEIFSAASNPDRKKPFDIRTVMRAL